MRQEGDLFPLARALLEAARAPTLVLDAEGVIVAANAAFCRRFLVRRRETEGRSVFELPGTGWDETELRALLARGPAKDGEQIGMRFSFEEDLAPRRLVVHAHGTGDGGAILVIEDPEEARRGALHLTEMGHRVRNLLETVQSVASQTMQRARSLEEFREAFEVRLQALGRAHGLLTRRDWKDVELEELLRLELEPYAGRPERIRLEGPALALPPREGLVLHLVLHELATNAAKYGALARPDGRVEVEWSIAPGARGEKLCLQWTETGGPEVELPRERGFGTRVIENHVRFELDGETRLEFASEGVRCRIVLPWSGNGDA